MFRSLFNSFKKSSAPPARKARPRRPRTLRLESLETREMCTANAAPVSAGASGKPIEGIELTTPISFHAKFTNHKPKLSDFTVKVDWGDGKTDVVKNISVHPNDKSPNPVEYIGNSMKHTYAEDGQQKGKFRVIVTNVTDKITWDATAYNMIVSDAPIRGKAVTIQPTTDKPFTGIVARFTDDNPNASLTEYKTKNGGATIYWKDGSNESSKGEIKKEGNEFVVYGTHSFRKNGVFEVQVNINDDGGSKTFVYSTAITRFTNVAPKVTGTSEKAGVATKRATRVRLLLTVKVSGEA